MIDLNIKFPMENVDRLCFLKNIITNPNIIVGDYTYYDDPESVENFNHNVLYHFDFIGDKLIIGKFCQIATGVQIGDGAIIASGSIVTKDVVPYSIVGGNPATLIRKRFDDETIAKLIKLAWWDWPFEKVAEYAKELATGDGSLFDELDI